MANSEGYLVVVVVVAALYAVTTIVDDFFRFAAVCPLLLSVCLCVLFSSLFLFLSVSLCL